MMTFQECTGAGFGEEFPEGSKVEHVVNFDLYGRCDQINELIFLEAEPKFFSPACCCERQTTTQKMS